jgi:hypothetical protein
MHGTLRTLSASNITYGAATTLIVIGASALAMVWLAIERRRSPQWRSRWPNR